jgi:hypothetical protein
MSFAIGAGNFQGSLDCSVMRYLKLTIFYHPTVIDLMERISHFGPSQTATFTAEQDMKIYLLMALIGILLTAIRFTSVPDQPPKTLPR